MDTLAIDFDDGAGILHEKPSSPPLNDDFAGDTLFEAVGAEESDATDGEAVLSKLNPYQEKTVLKKKNIQKYNTYYISL